MHLVSLWKLQENISGRPYARVIRYLFFVSHYPKGKRGHHYFPNFCPACWSSFNGNMSQLDRSGRDWNSDPLHVSRTSLERHGGCSFYSVFFFLGSPEESLWPKTAWLPRSVSGDQWLQIDIKQSKTIKAVATQGYSQNDMTWWCKTYSLSYSKNDGIWHWYQENSITKVKYNSINRICNCVDGVLS